MAARYKRRIFLETAPDRFNHFAWFAETKGAELLFAVHGTGGTSPCQTHRIPAKVVTTDELGSLDFAYADLASVGIGADHFTYHRDGAFHLRRSPGSPALYSDNIASPSIDRSTGRFLDVIVMGDRVDEYKRVSSTPKPPAVRIQTKPDAHVTMRAWVSGVDYDLAKLVQSELRSLDGVCGFALGTFKVALKVQGIRASCDVMANRPRGAIVSFRFLTGPGQHLLKTFVFS